MNYELGIMGIQLKSNYYSNTKLNYELGITNYGNTDASLTRFCSSLRVPDVYRDEAISVVIEIRNYGNTAEIQLITPIPSWNMNYVRQLNPDFYRPWFMEGRP